MPILLSAAPEKVSIGAALGYSLLGIAIVFAALIILWGIINIMASIMKKSKTKTSSVSAPASEGTSVPTAPAKSELAPGSAGNLKIYDVPEKTAAILMAIVANKMNQPLNELRFISIKEVK